MDNYFSDNLSQIEAQKENFYKVYFAKDKWLEVSVREMEDCMNM